MNNNLLKQIQEFAKLWGGFRASRVVLTANNLGIFELLKTAKTAIDIAKAAETDPRSTEILLDAVTSLGLIKKTGSKYRNTQTANKFLVKESRLYQGDMLRHADNLWKSWSGLDEVVKSGHPNRSGSLDHESFIRAMHNNSIFRAKEVISAIDLKGVTRVLDLGGGPGVYSLELARRRVSVTLFDLPETIAVAKKIVGDVINVYFISGNFHTDDIGSGYDLIFISHIFHSLSVDEIQALIEKSAKALNPKGKIVVQEFLLQNDRAHPVSGALFSVNMLVNTVGGRSYTPTEMKTWLLKKGFKGIRTKTLGETVLVSGKKD